MAGLPIRLQAVQPAGQLLYAQLPYFIHQQRHGIQDHASWETARMAEELLTCRTRQQELSICGISNKLACHMSTCCLAMILAQSQSNWKISKFPRCKNDLLRITPHLQTFYKRSFTCFPACSSLVAEGTHLSSVGLIRSTQFRISHNMCLCA